MAVTSSKRRSEFSLENLESYHRIINIPVVYRGWKVAGNVYGKIKNSNDLFSWTFSRAENSVKTVYATTSPAVVLFQFPLKRIDQIICKSLDFAEERVPSIHLPPETIISNTKGYISDMGTKFIRPVLKRADSVKQIGNSVLTNKITEFAADKLDDALDAADIYIDKYLPPEKYDDQKTFDGNDSYPDVPGKKALHTIHHVDKVSRKLHRRLTKRYILEAEAFKVQSAEAINVLLYVAELIVKDPKQAYQQGKELWASLSKDEPENQARPENLEQLLVLLTRESARRLVHLINFSSTLLTKVPKYAANTLQNSTALVFNATDSAIKKVHLDGVEQVLIKILRVQVYSVTIVLKEINHYASDILDELAKKVKLPADGQSLLVPKIEINSKAAKKNVSSKKISDKHTYQNYKNVQLNNEDNQNNDVNNGLNNCNNSPSNGL